jgi:hypothetical protein
MRVSEVLAFAVYAFAAVLTIAAVVLTYYVISYGVLALVSKLLPLAGRRRR